MGIDLFKRRQVAVKVVNLISSHQKPNVRPAFLGFESDPRHELDQLEAKEIHTATKWSQEVKLLKDISHV